MFLAAYMLALADYHFVFDTLSVIFNILPVLQYSHAVYYTEVCNALANSEQTL